MGKLANKRKRNASPAAIGRFAEYEWLVSLIWLLRPDLRKLFKASDGINMEFARWLLTSGREEYRSLAVSEGLKSVLCKPLKILGVSPLEAMIYLERPDVQKAFPLPEAKSGLHEWFIMHGVDEHKVLDLLSGVTLQNYYAIHPEKINREVRSLKENKDLPFGVNLHGYAYGQLGIGEDLRMTARALQDAHVPFTIINFPPGADIPQNDRSMEQYVGTEAPYKFNVFCMTALETARYYAERGHEMFEGRYNIGYWPWELSKWPEEWKGLTRLVDEVWVSSRHIYDSLAPISCLPVLIMPLAVETVDVAPLSRTDFQLPEDAYLFCFSFDFNSSIHRKNPQACLAAFQRAFPRARGDKVGLVIKCHRPAAHSAHWEKLKEIASSDDRIHVLEATLSRPELLALYKNCNCYLSLHRAEGYGRGIAEALLLGLEVIATRYSGNLDYCIGNPRAHLVCYRLIPIQADQYPFGDEQKWAEANLDDAARLMRECVTMAANPEGNVNYAFDLKTCGQRYAQRLRYLFKNI